MNTKGNNHIYDHVNVGFKRTDVTIDFGFI